MQANPFNPFHRCFSSNRALLPMALLAVVSVGFSGCVQGPFASRDRELDYVVYDQAAAESNLSKQQRLSRLTGEAPFQVARLSSDRTDSPLVIQSPQTTQATQVSVAATEGPNNTETVDSTEALQAPVGRSAAVVRAQSPDNGFNWPGGSAQQISNAAPAQPGFVARASNPDDGSAVRSAAYQYPELATPGGVSPSFGLASPNIGAPNEMNPLIQPYERGGNATFPQNYADLDVYVQETQTGKINFGGAYNSDNGIVGQFIIDERNFDIRRFPRSLREVWDGTAWRGGGQTFRLELVPGANLQRYLVSFSEPYFLNTNYSFSASGYLFQRQYFDWDEQRLGGRFSLGRRLDQDISINAGVRLESVKIDNPRLGTSAELNNALGTSNLFLGNIGLIRDTRDNPMLATKGTYFSAIFSQAFGDYNYSRADLDYRRYRLMYERPDGSGRHTVSFGTKLGFSGDSTPIFENYYAGGFSTLRGFDFRGAAPLEAGVRVGGEFQWLNTVEYMFPLTADDMVKGVMFCDFGTVEEGIELNKENFRVAPGFGFRIHMPAAGIGAPLAFDFAFPISTADGDDEKMFSFYLGVTR